MIKTNQTLYCLPKGAKIKTIQEEYDVLTVVELCELLGISRKYAYQFIRENNIKYIRVGRKFYVSKKSLDNILKMES